MKTALLIIDMQHALCLGEEAAFDIANVIDKVNALSRRARDSGAPVVLIQHEEDGSPLQFGEPGWELTEGLMTAAEDIRIRKRTPSSFHETALHQSLLESGVSRLVVCGLQTDCCVNATVRQAQALGYAVVLTSDAHSTADGAVPAAQVIVDHNIALGQLSHGPLIDVVPAAEVRFAA